MAGTTVVVRGFARGGRAVRAHIRTHPNAIYGSSKQSLFYGKINITQVTRRSAIGSGVRPKLFRYTNAPTTQGVVAPGQYAQTRVAGGRPRVYANVTASSQGRIARLARGIKTMRGRTLGSA